MDHTVHIIETVENPVSLCKGEPYRVDTSLPKGTRLVQCPDCFMCLRNGGENVD